MFTYQRPGLSLDGTWKFCPDPMQRCRRQKWWANPPKPNSAFPCWDLEGLWDIQVPGTWKTQFPELTWYDGHAVYVKDFALPELPADHEAFLVCDGIVYAAELYLNGLHLTRHDWGYSPFQVRITDYLRDHNRLFVLVDNHLKPDRVPGEVFDWNNDGGIINPVRIVWVPRVYLENYQLRTRLEADDVVVEVTVHLASRDAAAATQVTVRLPELDLSQTLAVSVGQPASCSFSLFRETVEMWRPGNPKLYRLELETPHETLTDEVGLREVRTEGRQILLNGKPLRLYGLCTHAEFPGTGRSATTAGIELLLERARQLGVNFLRCAHYPYPAAWGRALDRAGLLWWQEVPAYWLPNMGQPGQIRLAAGMLEETIRRDWNRASLIVWSVSNECCWRNPDQHLDNNYAWWQHAVPLVRRLDPSRLLSCAEAGNHLATSPVWNPLQADEFKRDVKDSARWALGHADEWYRMFDILAANFYVDLGEAPTAYTRLVELLRPFNKPLMLSEFGSMSLRGAEVPADTLGSEARHAAVLHEAYDTFARLPELVGYCPWCLADIRVPIHWRWYNGGKGLFRYGVCDELGQPKETVFPALQQAIAQLKRHHGD